jgi:hypothetical protein
MSGLFQVALHRTAMPAKVYGDFSRARANRPNWQHSWTVFVIGASAKMARRMRQDGSKVLKPLGLAITLKKRPWTQFLRCCRIQIIGY